ncbi:MAG: VPLPA-CTERM sorting domain-containing protein [Gammaproteobacteria bacterium]|nr:VPLPA-CTERM sorting domain-containing protein [Gammaproteobacteria bacterium]
MNDISFITNQPAWVDENNVVLAPSLQPNYVGASITITDTEGFVPVPAAVWLFGSGLIGIVGLARRKAHA